jgi:hypothetical protein
MRNVHRSPAFAFLYKPAGVFYLLSCIRLSTMVGAFFALAPAPVFAKLTDLL